MNIACRALCYLSLKMYREAVSDCDEALLMDSANIKAFYRRAQAYKGLRVSSNMNKVYCLEKWLSLIGGLFYKLKCMHFFFLLEQGVLYWRSQQCAQNRSKQHGSTETPTRSTEYEITVIVKWTRGNFPQVPQVDLLLEAATFATDFCSSFRYARHNVI